MYIEDCIYTILQSKIIYRYIDISIYFLYISIQSYKVIYTKLLELISEFGKVTNYKVNVKRSIFLYTSNSQLEMEF